MFVTFPGYQDVSSSPDQKNNNESETGCSSGDVLDYVAPETVFIWLGESMPAGSLPTWSLAKQAMSGWAPTLARKGIKAKQDEAISPPQNIAGIAFYR